MSKPALDLEVIASFRDLQTEDDPHFLRDYLLAFLAPIPGRLAAIGEAIKNQDYPSLGAETHALRSSCANTGLALMTDLCDRLEQLGKNSSINLVQLGKNSSIDSASGLFEQLKAEFAQVKAEIDLLPEFKK